LVKEYTAAATDPSAVGKDMASAFALILGGAEKKVAAAEASYQESLKTNKYVDDMKTALDEEKAKADLVKTEQQTFLQESKAALELGDAKAAIAKLLASPGKGALAELLDKEKGHTVTDHSIFKSHASYYEKEFLEDMRALGVRDADAITRVTEYVQHIVKYVEKIVENGFAYEAQGSVYFDTAAFVKKGYHYAKLNPWCVGNINLTQSGEGSLSTDAQGKRNGMDFALWKTSKRGEPEWPSPWGQGRPGWHIEVSCRQQTCNRIHPACLPFLFLLSGSDDRSFSSASEHSVKSIIIISTSELIH
jgi:hypothetical protein